MSQMDTNQGKQPRAMVTGASSGIGAVYAEKLARRGYELVLVARNEMALDEMATRLIRDSGRSVEALPADLSQGADLARVAARLDGDAAITMLVNNAGIGLRVPFGDSTAEQVAQVTALNVTAVAVLAHAAALAFARRGAGTIVNMTSVTALTPEMANPTYAASKAFILTLSQALAHQLSDTGVFVQAVLPGVTRTSIWERSGEDLNAFPPDFVMDADPMVEAALAGLDMREPVTIPSLEDDGAWNALQSARLAMLPHLSKQVPARRYAPGRAHAPAMRRAP